VLDSSVALSWCFADEENPESLRILKLSVDAVLLVPVFWHVEMANILGLALKTNRMTRTQLTTALSRIDALGIATASELIPLQSQRILNVMADYDLTAYDACYLDLSLATELPLATFDKKLTVAARRANVELIATQKF